MINWGDSETIDMTKNVLLLTITWLFIATTSVHANDRRDGSPQAHLKYSLTDHFLETELGGGEIRFSAQDLKSKDRGVGSAKWFDIAAGFRVGISIVPKADKEKLTGFGLWLKSAESNEVFSWDWFHVDSESEATKIQGDGRLRLNMNQGKDGWVVSSIEVIEGFTLRGRDMVQKECNVVTPPKGAAYRWACTISKGSVLRFE
jgi:hypothetical protein